MAETIEPTHKETFSAYGQRRAGASNVRAMTGVAWLKGSRLNMTIGRMHWWGPLGEMIDGLALINQADEERVIKIPGMLMWRKQRGRLIKKEDIWLRAQAPNGQIGLARCDHERFQEIITSLASRSLETP